MVCLFLVDVWWWWFFTFLEDLYFCADLMNLLDFGVDKMCLYVVPRAPGDEFRKRDT